MLIQQQIKELFDYQDGMLFWKNGRSGIKTDGSEAGCIHHTGYRVITVNSKSYKVHRLIWIMFNGDIPKSCVLDHKDRNKLNNNIENLRLVTAKQNNLNVSRKGFTWCKDHKKWRVQITGENKKIHIGFFDTELTARAAYLKARKNYYGEFA
jgi:hypothetical protein